MKHLPRIAWVLVILVAIVSCIKFIYEPDIWWQIATGNWIIENGNVPVVDVFSHTYAGEPWINVKWGAEVLMALVDRTFGVELLPILQIACLLGILFFIRKLYNQFAKTLNVGFNKKMMFGLIIASLLMLFVVNFRLNSRPEMFSHLFSMAVLFLIINHKRTKSNLIFLLIPLQIVWTNIHEAYGMGIVLISIFFISFWIEFLFLKKQDGIGISFKPTKFSIAGIVAILAVAINPHGFKMIAHPFNILGQLSENKFTQELISVGSEGYWKYQSILMVIITLIIIYSIFTTKKVNFILKPIKSFGLGYCVVLAAFLYLSFTSFRNIPFFLYVATPVLGSILASFELKREKKTTLYLISIVTSLLFYVSITTNYFYEKLLPIEQYGLKINAEKTPIGASNFIKKNKLEGKEFVDYLSSSYLIYDVPNFKSYLDLRDLDVFPSIFFENVFFIYQAPMAIQRDGKTPWQFADEIDSFNYVMLLNSSVFQNLNLYLTHQSKDFVLVYADMLNSIYVRDTPKNKKLLAKYGFDKEKIIFNQTTEAPTNILGDIISNIFWPPYSANSNLKKNLNQNYSAYKNYLRFP